LQFFGEVRNVAVYFVMEVNEHSAGYFYVKNTANSISRENEQVAGAKTESGVDLSRKDVMLR